MWTSHFSVDHGNDGGFDLHAGGHSNVEQLMIEAWVDDGLDKEQRRVQVTFPDFRVIVLSERDQRSASNSESASQLSWYAIDTSIELSYHVVFSSKHAMTFLHTFYTVIHCVNRNVQSWILNNVCWFSHPLLLARLHIVKRSSIVLLPGVCRRLSSIVLCNTPRRACRLLHPRRPGMTSCHLQSN